MAMFASPAELGDLLGQDINPDDPRAVLLLETATGLIQAETAQTLFRVVDDAVTYSGTWSAEFWLPERPVVSVSSVKINGLTIVTGGYTWSSYGQLYRGRLPLGNGPEWDEFDYASSIPGANSWGGPTSQVAIIYTHGFAVIPPDLRGACLAVAARGWSNPSTLQSETIGAYSYTNQAAVPAGLGLSSDEKGICSRYRRDVMSLGVAG